MAGFYGEEIIEEVRSSNDIVDVVSEYVKLEKKGKYLFGCCPFHKEKTPSFSVTPSRQMFYCYSCGKGGNVFHFIMGVENLNFIDTVKLLADRARIDLPVGEGDGDKEKIRLKQEILNINKEAARFYYEQLANGESQIPRTYIKERGLSERIQRRFGLGYSPNEWDTLFKYLTGLNFNEEDILKSGLVLKDKNGRFYDRFRNRVMFPIFDVRGNIIGFGGRVIDDSMPKYMNSPESIVYNKGRHLYGLNFAKNSEDKRFLIVEGYMDVISLHQSGIINTVAPLGTALTESQGRLLKAYAEEIIIAFDADTAGQAAALRGLDILNDIGCKVRVLSIPKGKDPDEFIKTYGGQAFKELIDKAVSLLEYKIKVLKGQINIETTDGKISFLNKTADVLSKVDNNIEREMYTKKLSKEYQISEEALYAEVLKRIRPQAELKVTAVSNDNVAHKSKGRNLDDGSDKLVHFEKILLILLCNDNSIYKNFKDKININYFTDESNKNIAKILLERLEIGKNTSFADMLALVLESEAGEFARIIEEDYNFEDNKKAFLDIIKKIDNYKLDKRQQEILEILKDTSGHNKDEIGSLKIELQNIILQKKIL